MYRLHKVDDNAGGGAGTPIPVGVENILSSDATASADIAGLTFTGLTIGAKYSLKGQISLDSEQGFINGVQFRGGSSLTGTLHGTVELVNETVGLRTNVTSAVSLEFTADSTTLYTNKPLPDSTVFGDGTKNRTFLQLREIPQFTGGGGGGADLQLSNLTGTTAIPIDLDPSGTLQRDIGNTSKQWQDIYLRNIKFYKLGGTQTGSMGTNNFAGNQVQLIGDNAGLLIATKVDVNPTGNVAIESGAVSTGNPKSGDINLKTGAVDLSNTGNSGAVNIKTSDAGLGSSGGILVKTGISGSGIRGVITLDSSARNVVLASQPANNSVPLAVSTVQYSDVGNVGISFLRPATPLTGQRYFDTTLGLPIWYDGANWINALGTTV